MSDVFKVCTNCGKAFFTTEEDLCLECLAAEVPFPPEADGDARTIHHPPHYTMGSIECWDFIADQGLDYFLGCAVKYIVRCGRKGDPIEDLKKAANYLRKKIELLEITARKTEGEASE